MRLTFVVAVVACALNASIAAADPIPFAAVSSVPRFNALQITFGATWTLSSADVANPTHPTDPVYGQAAPVVVDEIPSVAGVALGYFKLPDISLTGVLDDGSTTFLRFGPGMFSIATLDLLSPLGPLVPFVDASFASVVIGLANDGSSRYAIGSAAFSGVAFTNSGLQHPGGFLFNLGERTLSFENGTAQFNYPITLGVLGAEPTAAVPEPATMLLVGTGLAGLARARRNRRR